MTGIECDHMNCDAALEIEPCLHHDKVRASATAAGWQTVTTPTTRHFCPQHRWKEGVCSRMPRR